VRRKMSHSVEFVEEDETSRSPSSSSTDSSEGESDMRFVTRNRRHRSGRLSGGARDPLFHLGGAGDPALSKWRGFGVPPVLCDGVPRWQE